MQFDTLFFDIGNTLFFYNYDFLRGLLSDRFQIDIHISDLEEAHAAVRRSILQEGLVNAGHDALWNESYRRWLRKVHVEEEKIDPIMEAIRHHPFKHLFWSRIEEGTKEMLDWFRERGFKLGVISNAEGQIRRLIEHAGLESRFDAIVDSAEVGVTKPDQKIFELALLTIGASAKKSIHVGDIYDIDVLGAQSAGVTPILVDKEGRVADAPCLTVRSATELPRLPIFSEVA